MMAIRPLTGLNMDLFYHIPLYNSIEIIVAKMTVVLCNGFVRQKRIGYCTENAKSV